MIRTRHLAVILAVSVLLTVGGCKEERPFWTENYNNRQVICVKLPNGGPDSLLKFEFNDGRNLSAVYWQRNKDFGYLFDLRAKKLFIDAASGLFFSKPADFYQSLERDIDCQKIKDSLTKKIVGEFCEQIDKAAAMTPAKTLIDPKIFGDLEKVKQALRGIDLEPWYRAVDLEKNKIHALGLEYCVSKEQAETLFSKINFDLDYRRIIERRIGDLQAVSRKGLAVCIGENHPEDSDKEEAARAVSELRQLGFKYLLVECILAVDQKILDDYRPADKATRLELWDYLNKEGWNDSVKFGGKGIFAYFEVIEQAKRLGYKVLGIGNQQRDDIEFLRNNYWMALNVAEVFKKDPGARVITFTGATHVFPNYLPPSGVILEGYLMRQDIPDILKKTVGIEAIVFECIGGLKDVEYRKYLDPEKVLEKHIEKRGLDRERFFIPVPPEISTLSPEGEYYYIHLPQY